MNTFDFCYTTRHELEFLELLRQNNRPAFVTICRIILEDQRRYDKDVDVVKIKEFVGANL